jgi:hypothetical protein
MRHSPPQTQLKSIARDAAVKAHYIADRTTTNARLGETLQRLYAPVDDEPPAQLGVLLMRLDQRFSGQRP